MQINSARYDAGRLILSITDIRDAVRFTHQFKAGEYKIVKAKRKRSLDANAYCWVLLDKLSDALRLPKEELYRNAIRNIGGVSETFCGKTGAVKTLTEKWCSNGLGWQFETFPSKLEGCTNVTLYYGSSTYDVAQMSRLIDYIVQDCQAVGIDTKPEEEIKSLLEEWHE